MEKVVVTGANGFIGSYVSKKLLQKGLNVIAISKSFHLNTKQLLSGAQFIELNILDKEQLCSHNIEADAIIHTATPNDIISKDVLQGIELSVVGTKNILDFATKNKIPRCIVFSTLQVYGTELVGEIDENSKLEYQNDYGLNHLFAENYAEMYTRQGKLNCVSVRPSNVYGRILTEAFNRWTLVPGCFCKESIETGKITIKSSGKQMRNFVNLENLSEAVYCILNNFPKSYQVYNIASSVGYTMLDVAKITQGVFFDHLKRSIDIIVEGTEPLITNEFHISIDKLNNIGFVEDNKFDLKSEIKEIIEYLLNNNKIKWIQYQNLKKNV